jgi:hypothetical protein
LLSTTCLEIMAGFCSASVLVLLGAALELRRTAPTKSGFLDQSNYYRGKATPK